MASKKTVGILGAGAWGTAFAQALARGGHEVTLWAMEDDVVSSINDEHENKRFLRGFKLESTLRASGDIEEVVSGKDSSCSQALRFIWLRQSKKSWA